MCVGVFEKEGRTETVGGDGGGRFGRAGFREAATRKRHGVVGCAEVVAVGCSFRIAVFLENLLYRGQEQQADRERRWRSGQERG